MTEELTGVLEAQPPKRKRKPKGFSIPLVEEAVEISQAAEVESVAEEAPEAVEEEVVSEQQIIPEPEEERVEEAPRTFIPPVRPLQGGLLRNGKRGAKRAGSLSR